MTRKRAANNIDQVCPRSLKVHPSTPSRSLQIINMDLITIRTQSNLSACSSGLTSVLQSIADIISSFASTQLSAAGTNAPLDQDGSQLAPAASSIAVDGPLPETTTAAEEFVEAVEIQDPLREPGLPVPAQATDDQTHWERAAQPEQDERDQPILLDGQRQVPELAPHDITGNPAIPVDLSTREFRDSLLDQDGVSVQTGNAEILSKIDSLRSEFDSTQSVLRDVQDLIESILTRQDDMKSEIDKLTSQIRPASEETRQYSAIDEVVQPRQPAVPVPIHPDDTQNDSASFLTRPVSPLEEEPVKRVDFADLTVRRRDGGGVNA